MNYFRLILFVITSCIVIFLTIKVGVLCLRNKEYSTLTAIMILGFLLIIADGTMIYFPLNAYHNAHSKELKNGNNCNYFDHSGVDTIDKNVNIAI